LEGGRPLEALRKYAVSPLAIGLSLYVLYNAFNPMPPLQERAIFLLLILSLAFLKQASGRKRIGATVVDLSWCALGIVIFGYVVADHEEIAFRSGIVTQADMILGLLCIVYVLEVTRRVVGWPLVITALVFLAYGFFGQHLPRWLGGHGGFDLDRVVTLIYLSGNGVFGVATYVTFKFVFLFVLFGKLLEASGALGFVMEFASALVGRFRGGPAMMAVVSSGLMGSVSGSAVANVMVTGSITIPLMKRTGFAPHVAGAVEAAASTGGQFMPPVMGAAAFLMMQFLAVEYLEIVKAAFIPAVLYFLGVLAAVYFYSLRAGLQGLPRSELPSLRALWWRADGLVFFAGVGALIVLLALQISPIMAVLRAMAVIALLAICIGAVSVARQLKVRPAEGMRSAKQGSVTVLRKGLGTLEDTGIDFVQLGAAVACVGIIMGLILMTGLAARFSGLVVGIAGDNLLGILIMTMFASMILGMGLPTSVAYIILALMVAPLLVKVGVAPMAAHLFIFFSGMLSMVTPPVALAAYAGATIAGADFWRTGLIASLISLPVYILPYAFVFGPPLLMNGTLPQIMWFTSTAALGVILVAFSLIGVPKDRLEAVARFIAFIAALLLITPEKFTDLVGFGLAVFALVLQYGRTVTLRAVRLRASR
jgi:TRAP transporter 4TM/12TM fusion protein